MGCARYGCGMYTLVYLQMCIYYLCIVTLLAELKAHSYSQWSHAENNLYIELSLISSHGNATPA